MSIQVKHLTLQYYSILIQKGVVKVPGSELVLFMCLYIAAKFVGECPPEFAAYKCAMVNNKIGHSDAMTLEKFIMHGLGWKCTYVTSSEILDLLFTTFFSQDFMELKQKATVIIDFCLTGKLFL